MGPSERQAQSAFSSPRVGISYTDRFFVQGDPDDIASILADDMRSLADRLKRAMDARGITQAELARAVGISRASVSDWLSGKTKSIDGANLIRAAEALAVSPRWLQTGFGQSGIDSHAESTKGNVPVSESAYDQVHLVPLLTWSQVSMMAPGGSRPLSSETYPVAAPVGPNAFALRQQGNSMEPRIPDGAVVIIDPDLQPEHGHVVLARRPQDSHAMLRQLWFDGGAPFLRPLNTEFPVVEMPPNTAMLGRALFSLEAL